MFNFFPVGQLELLFTKRCNMNCKYCFEKSKNTEHMNFDDLTNLLDNIPTDEFYMFGGEPMLDLDFVTNLYDAIEKKEMTDSQKTVLLKSIQYNTTNGTLIKNHADIIKKYDLMLQISLDGPKMTHDKNRIYADDKGTFDDVIEAAHFCKENGIRHNFHGAITNEEFPYMLDIFKFYWDLLKYDTDNDYDKVINQIGNNIFQIIFECEYTDNDLDTLFKSQNDIAEHILSLDEISMDKKKYLLSQWFKRRGSSCSAGNRLMGVDPRGDIYPCHRLAVVPDKEKYTLGNINGRDFKNFQLYNNFMQLNKNYCMFSSNLQNISWNGNLYGMNWCPSTNMQTSGSLFYQSSKYNVFIAEYNRFVEELFGYLKI